MVQYKHGWKCPYCHTEYNTHLDASRCARECVHVDEPEAVYIAFCEMCDGQHRTEALAIACETKHRENEDKFFRAWASKKNMEELKRAGESPGQKKLVEAKIW